MRPFRHTGPVRNRALAVGALALTVLPALTGCGSTSSDSAPPATSPATTTTAPSTEQTTTAPPTSAAPTTSGSASASPSAAGTGDAPTTAAPVHVTTYSDKTGLLQLPVSNASLPGAPAGLVDFARSQLKTMWHDQFQNDPGCEGIAQLLVKRVSATSAYVAVSWGATTPTCPQYAGNPGWWEVWGNQGGTWSLTLHGEGLASCDDLKAHAISHAIYPTCTDGTRKVPNPVA